MKKPTSAVIIFLLAGAFAILLAPRLMQIRSLEARHQKTLQELEALKSQNQALENELRLLRDDPVYLEKVARAQFNKAKQGEIVYKIVRPGQTEEKK